MLSLIFIFCFVSTFFVIKSEDTVIPIKILDSDGNNCRVQPRYTLEEGSTFTLDVTSNFYIDKSSWFWGNRLKNIPVDLKDMENTNFRFNYEKSSGNTGRVSYSLTCTLSHTEKAIKSLAGDWTFRFRVFKNNAKFSSYQEEAVWIGCNTFIDLKKGSVSTKNTDPQELMEKSGQQVSDKIPHFAIILSVVGIVVLAQSAYIIYFKVYANRKINQLESAENVCNNDREPISPMSRRAKRQAKRANNIAQRPPLPLPCEEVINEGFTGTPVPSEPKQYRPTLMSPDLPRRAPASSPDVVQFGGSQKPVPPISSQPPIPSHSVTPFTKPPQRMPAPSIQNHSTPRRPFAKPTSRSPNRTLERPLKRRSNDLPPGLTPQPMKKPVFLPTQRKDWRDSSDEEWEYEKLQPMNNYIKQY